MEQPYFLFNSNIYNYYTGINNIYSKAPNEKIYDSKNFSSQFPHQEKIIRTVKNKKIVYCLEDKEEVNIEEFQKMEINGKF